MSDTPGVTVTQIGPAQAIEIPFTRRPEPEAGYCRVYWGSHGCDLERGHVERDGTPHDCGCCECHHHPYPEWPDENVLCVAKEPYYGPGTNFYGEDATPESVGRWGQVLESSQ